MSHLRWLTTIPASCIGGFLMAWVIGGDYVIAAIGLALYLLSVALGAVLERMPAR